MTTIAPLSDRVLVRVDDNETRTKGGILLPDNVRHNVTTGVVVAVGPGKVRGGGERRPIPVRPGDRVAFVKYGGASVDAFMSDHLMLREDEITGVIG